MDDETHSALRTLSAKVNDLHLELRRIVQENRRELEQDLYEIRQRLMRLEAIRTETEL